MSNETIPYHTIMQLYINAACYYNYYIHVLNYCKKTLSNSNKLTLNTAK